jgi:hypothetical protein
MAISRVSILAADFPTVEVEYVDLMGVPFKKGGRSLQGMDCLGLTLEVFRRAGLGFDDPTLSADGMLGFADLFEPVVAPDRLYDLILSQHRQPFDDPLTHRMKGDLSDHLSIVVRLGTAFSTRARNNTPITKGPYTVPVNRLKARAETMGFYRVKDAVLPD